MGESVTFKEFARRVGISRPRISQLVAEGRLPTVPGPTKRYRRIPWAEGKAAWDIDHGIDPAPGGLLVSEVADLSPQRTESPAGQTVDVAVRMAKAKADDKAYQAETRRLKLEELRGSLIPAVEVKAEAEACAIRVRSALSSLPSRLALRLEGRTAPEIEALLADEIGAALRQLREAE